MRTKQRTKTTDRDLEKKLFGDMCVCDGIQRQQKKLCPKRDLDKRIKKQNKKKSIARIEK